MFKILDFTKDNLIAFKVKGDIEKSDYEKLNALLDKTAKEYETLNIYIEVQYEKIEGIDPEAVWEDIKTYFKHTKNVGRLAVVANSTVVKNLTKLSRPFISGEVKYFLEKEAPNAREWTEVTSNTK